VTGLHRLARQIASFFTGHDLWLTPVVAEPPPVLGSFDALPDDPLAAFRRAWAFAPITGICNFAAH